MDEIRLLLKTIRAVGKGNPVTYMQLSEIIRRLWRPRVKVYSVYQAAHGFSVGDAIKPADPLWVKAKADTLANAKATAVVSEIIDVNNFIYLQEGLVAGDYIIGAKYFLSITTAGAMFVQSDPEAWTAGNYRQMIGTGTADGLLVEIDEGEVIKDVVQSDWNQIVETMPDFIKNKPTIPSLPLEITGITLLSASWTLVYGLYEYDLANANITANHVVDVIPENTDIAIVKAADPFPKTVSSAGSVKLYATNAPTGNIGVTIILTTATT